MKKIIFSILCGVILLAGLNLVFNPLDAINLKTGNVPEGCTSITVGKLASADGSVMTSHTADTREHRTWVDIQPGRKYKPGEKYKMYKGTEYTLSADDLSKMSVVVKLMRPRKRPMHT